MRIVVLAGGLSMERNVSLSSGNKICRALRSRGHQAILVDMFLGRVGGSLGEVSALMLLLGGVYLANRCISIMK